MTEIPRPGHPSHHPDPAPAANCGQWSRWFYILLASVTAGRAVYAAFLPFDLAGDESYYWEWGRRLAWGYYSKPPLIGWLMGLADWLGGGSVTGIKWTALVLGTGSVLFLFWLARRMYDERVAFWAGLAMLATPANAAVTLMLTIDAPLLFCWSGALYCIWRIVSDGMRGNYGYLALLWVLIGIGCLAKQMMLVFPLLALLFFAIEPQERRQLADWRWWVALLSGVLFLLPTLWWNARHGWITFRHTSHHFAAAAFSIEKALARLAEFFGAQAGLLSPLTWGLLVAVLAAAAMGWRRLDKRARLLLWFSAPALTVVFLMNIRQRVQPNWPAVYFPPAFILLTAWAAGALPLSKRLENWRRFFRPGVWIGAGLAVLIYLLPYLIPLAGLSGSKVDPTARLRGWSDLGRAMEACRAGQPDGDRLLLIAAASRQDTSALAFYMPGQPVVYRWTDSRTIDSQYELWGGPPNAQGASALILTGGADTPLPETLARAFAQVRLVDRIRIPLGGRRVRDFTVYRGDGLTAWPKAALLQSAP